MGGIERILAAEKEGIELTLGMKLSLLFDPRNLLLDPRRKLRNNQEKARIFPAIFPTVDYDYENDTFLSPRVRTAEESAVGAVNADITVPTITDKDGNTIGEIWRVYTMQASFKTDANIADRTCKLTIPTLGMDVSAETDPLSHVIDYSQVLQADQFGYVTLVGNGITGWLNDNGTASLMASPGQNINIMPFEINAGGIIRAGIPTNPQATDASGIKILYRRVA